MTLPALVPMRRSAPAGSMPATRSRARVTPAWYAMPTVPPAPNTIPSRLPAIGPPLRKPPSGCKSTAPLRYRQTHLTKHDDGVVSGGDGGAGASGPDGLDAGGGEGAGAGRGGGGGGGGAVRCADTRRPTTTMRWVFWCLGWQP